MLIEFKTRNYKSFLDEMTFSMTPAPKQKDLSYSILQKKVDKKVYKALSGAVIYGPNAAGKSNIIGALDVLRNIVIRGHILNVEDNNFIPNMAANKLELIPNNTLKKQKPVDFKIKFIDEEFLFDYQLSLQLGNFIDFRVQRKILNETLYINNKLIYKRDDKVLLGDNFKGLEKNFKQEIFEGRDTVNSLLESSIKSDELFLNNGFKNIVSGIFADKITDWFKYKLVTIYDSHGYESNIDSKCYNFQKSTVYEPEYIREASKLMGIGSNMLGYMMKDNNQMVLTSVINDTKDSGKLIPAKIFESIGTIKFVNFIYPLLSVLKNGGTLVVDELDASLHTMLMMNLIGIFHNDEVNINKAQLIFSTHNPIFLNSSVFRRDEIKFVERDKEGYSSQYALSDIIFTEKQKVRKGADYMKNYFINRYGAIKDIDMTPIFEKAILDRDLSIVEKKGPGHIND